MRFLLSHFSPLVSKPQWENKVGLLATNPISSQFLQEGVLWKAGKAKRIPGGQGLAIYA